MEELSPLKNAKKKVPGALKAIQRDELLKLLAPFQDAQHRQGVCFKGHGLMWRHMIHEIKKKINTIIKGPLEPNTT